MMIYRKNNASSFRTTMIQPNCNIMVRRVYSWGALLFGIVVLANGEIPSPSRWTTCTTRPPPSAAKRRITTTIPTSRQLTWRKRKTTQTRTALGVRSRCRCSRFCDGGHPLAFASCAAPRFDTFAEYMIASWKITNTHQESTHEVMRSCGGAVQGIREIPFVLSSFISPQEEEEKEGPYHNRANDGFIYFNCGSYSSYTTDVSSSSSTTHPQDSLIFASVTLPPIQTPPRKQQQQQQQDDDDDEEESSSPLHLLPSRVLFSGRVVFIPNEEKEDTTSSVWNIESPIMARVYRERPSMSLELEDTNYQVERLKEIPSNIMWTTQQIGVMSSPHQPWMLQRVKWDRWCSSSVTGEEKEDDVTNGHIQKEDHDNETNHASSSSSSTEEEDGVVSITNPTNTLAWIVTQTMDAHSLHDTQNKIFISTTTISPSILEEGVVHVISMGAVCPVSQAVRAVVRIYNRDGKLRSIIRQEGVLHKRN